MAVGAYHSHQADRIIGETNNGGEMVELTVRTVDENVSYKSVTASRGKLTRAEPIAALYEQGRIHHAGVFGELEEEMCAWTPGEASPNRMDALVWALTELMLGSGLGWCFQAARAWAEAGRPALTQAEALSLALRRDQGEHVRPAKAAAAAEAPKLPSLPRLFERFP
jgi:hypothetical protein